MTLSLDSSVIIDLLRRRRSQVRDTMRQAQDEGAAFAISSIVLFELAYGAEISAAPAYRLDEVLNFISVWPLIPIDRDDAFAAARVRSRLDPVGRPIGSADLLIGAQALRRGWMVVTSNVRHLGRIRDLPLYDWRVSGDQLTPEQIARRLTSDS